MTLLMSSTIYISRVTDRVHLHEEFTDVNKSWEPRNSDNPENIETTPSTNVKGPWGSVIPTTLLTLTLVPDLQFTGAGVRPPSRERSLGEGLRVTSIKTVFVFPSISRSRGRMEGPLP